MTSVHEDTKPALDASHAVHPFARFSQNAASGRPTSLGAALAAVENETSESSSSSSSSDSSAAKEELTRAVAAYLVAAAPNGVFAEYETLKQAAEGVCSASASATAQRIGHARCVTTEHFSGTC